MRFIVAKKDLKCFTCCGTILEGTLFYKKGYFEEHVNCETSNTKITAQEHDEVLNNENTDQLDIAKCYL